MSRWNTHTEDVKKVRTVSKKEREGRLLFDNAHSAVVCQVTFESVKSFGIVVFVALMFTLKLEESLTFRHIVS